MLYGGLNGIVTLCKEEIFKRVTQEEIFLLVFDKVDLQATYLNPLREDSRPGAFFKWYNGILWFCDLADPIRGVTPRDCFQFIMDYYNITFSQSLQHINDSFQLGLSPKDDKVTPVKRVIEKLESKEKTKAGNHITFKAKSFDTYHRKHWSKFEISSKQLEEDEISAVIWFRFWSDKKQDWVINRPLAEETTYAICEWKDATKICKAECKSSQKWFTDCTKNHIGGLKKLPFTGNTLTITKSYKDWRVLTNQGLHCIWFQNEGMFPSKEKLEALCSTFDEIVIWFDNDNTGISAAKKLHQLISSFHNNVRYIHLPIAMLSESITDPSDCIYKQKTFFNNFIYNQYQWKKD